MRYRRNNYPRHIVVKFAGKCGCCGGEIAVGQLAKYDPAKRVIYHLENAAGDSPQCYGVLKRQHETPFVDVDRMYEEQCADICGH